LRKPAGPAGGWGFDAPGSYSLEVAPGGDTQGVVVPLKSSPAPIRITLKRGLRSTGKILDAATGKPMPDALVFLNTRDPGKVGSDRNQLQTRTNAAGEFVFRNVEAIPYYITVMGTLPDGTTITTKADGTHEYGVIGATPTIMGGDPESREIRVVKR
jgi:hypothetical protein